MPEKPEPSNAEAVLEDPVIPEALPVSDLPEEASPVREEPWPEESLPEPAAEEPSQPAPSDEDLWASVCERAKGRLPRDIEAILGTVNGVREGDILYVEADPGFYYNRFNRGDVLEALGSAASELLSKPIAAKVREKRPQGKTRSLDELRQYPEVRFV